VISYSQFCASHLHGRYGFLVALIAIVTIAAVAFLMRNPSVHVGPVGWSV